MRPSRPVLLCSLVAALAACTPAEKAGADTGADTGSPLSAGTDGTDGGGGAIDCSGRAVLVFVGEGGDISDSPAVLAAAALGATVQATNDEEELVGWIQAGDAAAVVVDAPARRPDDEHQPVFAALIEAGVPLIFGMTDLHREPTWMSLLGVTAVDQWDSRPLYPAPGASTDLFTLHQDVPAGMRGLYSSWAIDGHALVPTDGGEALVVYDSAAGTEAAVVTTHSGRVLVNGLFGDVFDRIDEDEDGLPDAQELFENELVLVGSCG